MLLKIFEVPAKGHLKNRKVLFAQLKCDSCQKVFERKAKGLNLEGNHFCSRQCTRREMKKGGLIDLKKDAHFLSVYGVKSNLNIPEIKSRANSPAAHEKRIETCMQKYGEETPMRAPSVKTKRERSCIEKYGTKNAFQADSVKKKIKKTFLRKYGVECLFSLDSVIAKRNKKQKDNARTRTSAIEQDFLRFLHASFPGCQIEHHVPIDRYVVDFCIDGRLYIHFDGVYWHGLDRPLEKIKEFKTRHDHAIYRAHLKDRRQDKLFREKGLHFIRITDQDFKCNSNDVRIKIENELKKGVKL